MDSATLSLAHALEMGMALPAAAMALAPVRGRLRIPERGALPLAAVSCVILVALGTIVCPLSGLPSNAVLVPGMLALFVPYARLVRLPLAKKLFCFANSAMLCAFATLWAIVIASPWEAGNSASALLPRSGALALGLAAVLAALFARTLVVKLPALLANSAIDGAWPWLAAVPAALTLFICWMVPWDLSLMTLGRIRVIMLAITAFIPSVVWLLYDIAWRVISRVTEAARLQQEVTILGMEERRFRDLQGYVAETRALRHDFRHHLLAMSGLLESGKAAELASYLSQLTEAEELGQRPVLCDNAAVDALAAHYDATARTRGVRVSWSLALPEDLPVAEVDLCSVLGNLVENALNAAAGLPGEDRWVEVVSQEVTPSAIGVLVRNPYEGPLPLGEVGLPLAHEPGHGIGLSSVATTVERYHGGIDAHAEDGVFSCGAILYHG